MEQYREAIKGIKFTPAEKAVIRERIEQSKVAMSAFLDAALKDDVDSWADSFAEIGTQMNLVGNILSARVDDAQRRFLASQREG